MNTILLQKILDILRECLAHAGNFFKDLVVSDPQEGQVIGYDSGKWKNITLSELAVDLTDEAGPDAVITFSEAADMPLKSLVANIDVEGGTNAVVITRTGKNLCNPSDLKDQVAWNYITLKLKPNTTYTMSSNLPDSLISELACYFFSSTGSPSSATLVYNGHSTTITTLADGVVKIQQRRISGTDSFDNYQWQIEAGTSVTTFESYNGITETITLPSSIANGYVDVISGAGMDEDTSTTFSVTPVIIKSNTGINNIWADTGDVTAEYYTTTAGNIKSLVSISEDITDQVTVNTDNFSDVHVKVMKNNNVITIYLNSATAILGGQLLTGLPAPAYNMNIVVNDGSDSSPVGATLQTQGRLNVSAAAAQTVNALITYVAK